MAKKFDTNPLDPEFPEKVKQSQKEVETRTLPNQNGKSTRPFAEAYDTEEQTRRFDEAEFDSYNSTYGQEGTQPAAYKPASLYREKPNTRKVDKVGLPENLLVALPYFPFSIGLIAGILELVFVPKSETKVRFHAAQGMAAHIGIWIVTAILGAAENVTDLAGIANGIFWLVTTIMLIVFTYKAWNGKPIHIETVEGLTDWLEEKIKPQIK